MGPYKLKIDSDSISISLKKQIKFISQDLECQKWHSVAKPDKMIVRRSKV